MHSTTMRRVGGSVMLAVPPALLDIIGAQAGSIVDLDVDGGRLIVVPHHRPRYTLDELIAQCDTAAPDEDRVWIDGAPAGRDEL